MVKSNASHIYGGLKKCNLNIDYNFVLLFVGFGDTKHRLTIFPKLILQGIQSMRINLHNDSLPRDCDIWSANQLLRITFQLFTLNLGLVQDDNYVFTEKQIIYKYWLCCLPFNTIFWLSRAEAQHVLMTSHSSALTAVEDDWIRFKTVAYWAFWNWQLII